MSIIHSVAPDALAELVARARPSVVQVRSGGRGQGAGVVWRSDGAVVTNHHVIANAGRVEVELTDGRRLAAEVVQRAPELDLALLKLQVNDLPAATVANSAALRVGELVVAVGHPWGRPWVTTAGIVSGVGLRAPREGAEPIPYIQSDVRLAPGNSGGPLLDADGAVIGINAMVFGGDLAVAIPSATVTRWLGAEPSQPRGRLGASVQRAALPAEPRRGAWAGRASGLRIVDVEAGGRAARAGLAVGDLLLDAAGVAIDEPETLRSALERASGPLRIYLLRGASIVPVDV